MLLVLAGCERAFDAPANTSQIEKLAESTTADGWRYEYFRNLAYPCSLEGHHTFVIGTRIGRPDTAVDPLWVRLRGGGAGWFDASGTVRPDDAHMREEAFSGLRSILRQAGLASRINEHPASFRTLSVSMCNRDTYGGANNLDPNNFDEDSKQRRTSGLLATKAAIQFTLDRHATSDFFLHGGSAGSVGSYHVAWSLQEQGLAPAGIVADGGIRNDDWEIDRLEQDICSSRYGHPAMIESFSPRIHSALRAPSAQPHELISTGKLQVPVVQLWSQGDQTSCGSTPMDCDLADGNTVVMGATDCKNEALRAVIEAEGPASRSLSLGVCVTDLPDIPCNVHVSSRLDLPNTNPAHPEDYLATIVEWVDARLDETSEALLGAGLECPWDPTDTRRHTFVVAGDDNMVATGSDRSWLPASIADGDPRLTIFADGAWRPLIPGDGPTTFGPELSFAETLLTACPAAEIGIIKHAVPGATMSSWAPGGTNRGTLAGLIAGALGSEPAVVLEGALLQQSVGDATTATDAAAWNTGFTSAVTALRSGAAIPDDLPVFVVTERWGGYPDDPSGIDPDLVVGLLPGGEHSGQVIRRQWDAATLDAVHLTIVRDVPTVPGSVEHSSVGVRQVGRALATSYAQHPEG